jgi:hypothetical protein
MRFSKIVCDYLRRLSSTIENISVEAKIEKRRLASNNLSSKMRKSTVLLRMLKVIDWRVLFLLAILSSSNEKTIISGRDFSSSTKTLFKPKRLVTSKFSMISITFTNHLVPKELTFFLRISWNFEMIILSSPKLNTV